MPDRVLTLNAPGEAHQFTLTNASSGSAAAGSVVLLIPDGMTPETLLDMARDLVEIVRRNRPQISGV